MRVAVGRSSRPDSVARCRRWRGAARAAPTPSPDARTNASPRRRGREVEWGRELLVFRPVHRRDQIGADPGFDEPAGRTGERVAQYRGQAHMRGNGRRAIAAGVGAPMSQRELGVRRQRSAAVPTHAATEDPTAGPPRSRGRRPPHREAASDGADAGCCPRRPPRTRRTAEAPSAPTRSRAAHLAKCRSQHSVFPSCRSPRLVRDCVAG